MRWGHWTQLEAGKALAYLRDVIFPWFRGLGAEGSSFERYMGNAELKINKPALLIEACKLIEGMQIASQNQDVQGDLYEYLLERLSIAGRNGQFRTPRHIARMMVLMIAPQPNERVGDLAGGTCGFGVNSYQYVLEQHTSPEILQYDADGWPHNLVGDLLTPEQRESLQTQFFRAFDNDSGMTMLRIGSMNLMLHGIESPRFFYMDTLSKAYSESREYDVILMNPPFKGAVDKADVNPTLPGNTTKSELLFLHLILRALDMGGRCAVIVPDGVLFGSSAAHVESAASWWRRTGWTAWSRCRAACSSRMRGSPPRCCCSPAAPRPTASGSTTWRTTAFRWMTSASRPRRTTFPTSWTAGATGTTPRSRPSGRAAWTPCGRRLRR